MGTYFIIAAVSYLLGSIPFGYILVRVFLKQDIRHTGSGNIGATNVGRTGHRGLAIATLLLDAGKGTVAVVVGAVLAKGLRTYLLDFTLACESIAALFAVVGHMYPIWLRFKGGKGVATAAGAFLVISPAALAISLLAFLLTVGLSRYVSLGSIVASALFPGALLMASYFQGGWRRYPGISYVAGAAIGALVISKHHENIRRLLAGTENRLGAKTTEKPA